MGNEIISEIVFLFHAFVFEKDTIYCKVARFNSSRLEAHADFFSLLMKGIFDPYVLWHFEKKLIF